MSRTQKEGYRALPIGPLMIIHEAIESLFKNKLEIHCNPKEFIGQLTRTTITVFEPTRIPGKSWGVPLCYMFIKGMPWISYGYVFGFP